MTMVGTPPASPIAHSPGLFPTVIEFTSGSGSVKPLGRVQVLTAESFIGSANVYGPAAGDIALTNAKGKVIERVLISGPAQTAGDPLPSQYTAGFGPVTKSPRSGGTHGSGSLILTLPQGQPTPNGPAVPYTITIQS